MTPKTTQGPDIKNLLLAMAFATAIMFGWQHFYEGPRQRALQAREAAEAKTVASEKQRAIATQAEHEAEAAASDATLNAPRIRINTPSLHGSISLVGARLDDLTLAKYKDTQSDDAPEVKLLARASAKDAYFIELGTLGEAGTTLPTATSEWKSDDKELTPEHPVTLRWSNGAGLSISRTIAVDKDYLFTVTDRFENHGAAALTLYPYGLVSRNYADTSKHTYFMHEGPVGELKGALEDITYKDLRNKDAQQFNDSRGWLGMTDKYWLTAIIPDQGTSFDAEVKHFTRSGADAYQTNLRGKELALPVGGKAETITHVFAGAKVVDLLDQYREQLGIPLFDRAVDFGSLYFLTRPIFALLNLFYGYVGNFGIAIILLTCCIKALLYPLAHKSMISMSRMKLLSPKMEELKKRFGDDKMRLNQEVMALYKREKVNPVSGCLPILLQIPVFLALYRVLFVTIEMRQAPFYAWIHDLSAADPTNLFTLFGLVHWNPPGFLHLGVLPIIMCLTMVIQQRLNPKPADPVQATMMQWMPFVFLFMFASFPAGLVIYWVVNNTLSIVQQAYINTHLKKQGLK